MSSLRRACPFCLERLGTYSPRENVSIDLTSKRFYCFRCGKSGFLSTWAAGQLGVSVEDALSSQEIEKILKEDRSEEVKVPQGYVPLFPRRDVEHSVVLRPHVRYLRSRGVSFQLMQQFEVGIVLRPSREQWYMAASFIFPICDGQRKGFVRKNPKWLGYSNSRGLGRSGTIYNGDLLTQATAEQTVYVVEGVMDVFAMEGKAVATLGKDITDDQLMRLAESPARIIFALDGDAWRVSRCLSRRLAIRGKPAAWVRVPPGRDPGDLGFAAVCEIPTHPYP